jgi:hypothetical protein
MDPVGHHLPRVILMGPKVSFCVEQSSSIQGVRPLCDAECILLRPLPRCGRCVWPPRASGGQAETAETSRSDWAGSVAVGGLGRVRYSGGCA